MNTTSKESKNKPTFYIYKVQILSKFSYLQFCFKFSMFCQNKGQYLAHKFKVTIDRIKGSFKNMINLILILMIGRYLNIFSNCDVENKTFSGMNIFNIACIFERNVDFRNK